MKPLTFQYDALPARVVFGAGTIARLPEEAARLQLHRALIIGTAGQRKHAERAKELLGPLAAGVFPNAVMDGSVGKMLKAQGRHPFRPEHIHFLIEAPGYRRLVTHLFAAGDEYLDSDVVFGVKNSLVREYVRHSGGIAPDGQVMQGEWYSLHHEFSIAAERSWSS